MRRTKKTKKTRPKKRPKNGAREEESSSSGEAPPLVSRRSTARKTTPTPSNTKSHSSHSRSKDNPPTSHSNATPSSTCSNDNPSLFESNGAPSTSQLTQPQPAYVDYREPTLSNTNPVYQMSEPAVYQGREPAVYQAGVPVVYQGSEPAVYQGSEPAVYQGSEPAVYQGSEPAVYQGNAPAVYQGNAPAVYHGNAPAVYQGNAPAVYHGNAPAVYHGNAPDVYQGHAPDVYQGHAPDVYQGHAPDVYQGNAPDVYQGNAPAMYQGTEPFEYQGTEPFEYQGTEPFEYQGTEPFEYQGTEPFEYQGTEPFEYQGTEPFEYQGTEPFEYQGTEPFEYQGTEPFEYQGTEPFEYEEGEPFEYQGTEPFEYQGTEPFEYQGTEPFEYQGSEPFEYQEDEHEIPVVDDPSTSWSPFSSTCVSSSSGYVALRCLPGVSAAVSLNRTSKRYTNGESISGFVDVAVDDTCQCKRISIYSRGMCHMKTHLYQAFDPDDDLRDTFEESFLLQSNSMQLWPESRIFSAKEYIQVGHYRFPFSLRVPETATPSHREVDDSLCIEYSLMLEVSRTRKSPARSERLSFFEVIPLQHFDISSQKAIVIQAEHVSEDAESCLTFEVQVDKPAIPCRRGRFTVTMETSEIRAKEVNVRVFPLLVQRITLPGRRMILQRIIVDFFGNTSFLKLTRVAGCTAKFIFRVPDVLPSTVHPEKETNDLKVIYLLMVHVWRKESTRPTLLIKQQIDVVSALVMDPLHVICDGEPPDDDATPLGLRPSMPQARPATGTGTRREADSTVGGRMGEGQGPLDDEVDAAQLDKEDEDDQSDGEMNPALREHLPSCRCHSDDCPCYDPNGPVHGQKTRTSPSNVGAGCGDDKQRCLKTSNDLVFYSKPHRYTSLKSPIRISTFQFDGRSEIESFMLKDGGCRAMGNMALSETRETTQEELRSVSPETVGSSEMSNDQAGENNDDIDDDLNAALDEIVKESIRNNMPEVVDCVVSIKNRKAAKKGKRIATEDQCPIYDDENPKRKTPLREDRLIHRHAYLDRRTCSGFEAKRNKAELFHTCPLRKVPRRYRGRKLPVLFDSFKSDYEYDSSDSELGSVLYPGHNATIGNRSLPWDLNFKDSVENNLEENLSLRNNTDNYPHNEARALTQIDSLSRAFQNVKITDPQGLVSYCDTDENIQFETEASDDQNEIVTVVTPQRTSIADVQDKVEEDIPRNYEVSNDTNGREIELDSSDTSILSFGGEMTCVENPTTDPNVEVTVEDVAMVQESCTENMSTTHSDEEKMSERNEREWNEYECPEELIISLEDESQSFMDDMPLSRDQADPCLEATENMNNERNILVEESNINEIEREGVNQTHCQTADSDQDESIWESNKFKCDDDINNHSTSTHNQDGPVSHSDVKSIETSLCIMHLQDVADAIQTETRPPSLPPPPHSHLIQLVETESVSHVDDSAKNDSPDIPEKVCQGISQSVVEGIVTMIPTTQQENKTEKVQTEISPPSTIPSATPSTIPPPPPPPPSTLPPPPPSTSTIPPPPPPTTTLPPPPPPSTSTIPPPPSTSTIPPLPSTLPPAPPPTTIPTTTKIIPPSSLPSPSSPLPPSSTPTPSTAPPLSTLPPPHPQPSTPTPPPSTPIPPSSTPIPPSSTSPLPPSTGPTPSSSPPPPPSTPPSTAPPPPHSRAIKPSGNKSVSQIDQSVENNNHSLNTQDNTSREASKSGINAIEIIPSEMQLPDNKADVIRIKTSTPPQSHNNPIEPVNEVVSEVDQNIRNANSPGTKDEMYIETFYSRNEKMEMIRFTSHVQDGKPKIVQIETSPPPPSSPKPTPSSPPPPHSVSIEPVQTESVSQVHQSVSDCYSHSPGIRDNAASYSGIERIDTMLSIQSQDSKTEKVQTEIPPPSPPPSLLPPPLPPSHSHPIEAVQNISGSQVDQSIRNKHSPSQSTNTTIIEKRISTTHVQNSHSEIVQIETPSPRQPIGPMQNDSVSQVDQSVKSNSTTETVSDGDLSARPQEEGTSLQGTRRDKADEAPCIDKSIPKEVTKTKPRRPRISDRFCKPNMILTMRKSGSDKDPPCKPKSDCIQQPAPGNSSSSVKKSLGSKSGGQNTSLGSQTDGQNTSCGGKNASGQNDSSERVRQIVLTTIDNVEKGCSPGSARSIYEASSNLKLEDVYDKDKENVSQNDDPHNVLCASIMRNTSTEVKWGSDPGQFSDDNENGFGSLRNKHAETLSQMISADQNLENAIGSKCKYNVHNDIGSVKGEHEDKTASEINLSNHAVNNLQAPIRFESNFNNLNGIDENMDLEFAKEHQKDKSPLKDDDHSGKSLEATKRLALESALKTNNLSQMDRDVPTSNEAINLNVECIEQNENSFKPHSLDPQANSNHPFLEMNSKSYSQMDEWDRLRLKMLFEGNTHWDDRSGDQNTSTISRESNSSSPTTVMERCPFGGVHNHENKAESAGCWHMKQLFDNWAFHKQPDIWGIPSKKRVSYDNTEQSTKMTTQEGLHDHVVHSIECGLNTERAGSDKTCSCIPAPFNESAPKTSTPTKISNLFSYWKSDTPFHQKWEDVYKARRNGRLSNMEKYEMKTAFEGRTHDGKSHPKPHPLLTDFSRQPNENRYVDNVSKTEIVDGMTSLINACLHFAKENHVTFATDPVSPPIPEDNHSHAIASKLKSDVSSLTSRRRPQGSVNGLPLEETHHRFQASGAARKKSRDSSDRYPPKRPYLDPVNSYQSISTKRIYNSSNDGARESFQNASILSREFRGQSSKLKNNENEKIGTMATKRQSVSFNDHSIDNSKKARSARYTLDQNDKTNRQQQEHIMPRKREIKARRIFDREEYDSLREKRRCYTKMVADLERQLAYFWKDDKFERLKMLKEEVSEIDKELKKMRVNVDDKPSVEKYVPPHQRLHQKGAVQAPTTHRVQQTDLGDMDVTESRTFQEKRNRDADTSGVTLYTEIMRGIRRSRTNSIEATGRTPPGERDRQPNRLPLKQPPKKRRQ